MLLTLPLLLAAPLVSAHGAVTSYIINGQTYDGYQGFSPVAGAQIIQRQWPDYNPILTVTDAKMTCNGGTSAPIAATVAAGENVTAVWKQWTHAQGPVMVWMYSCDGEFTACDGKSEKWFKIDEMGMWGGVLNSENWGTALVMKNLEWSSKIPSSLQPGNYLIRHELLALHQADTPQFYPECAQLTVTGSGTAVPSGTFLTSIPAYAAQSDPGVMIDIYSSTATTYTPPGPAVWTGA